MNLPIPDSIALARSEKLSRYIRQTMELSNSPLSFAKFMELALYTPGLGYYSTATRLGKGGDFITAPEISCIFAECVARQCQEIYTSLGPADFLEIGAGSGVFAKDMLLTLEKLDALPRTYFIFEISPGLQAQQKKLLATVCPHLLPRIQWLDALPLELNGIIFANEVLDAMPVHCFFIENNTVQERCVTWDNNQFNWVLAEPSAELADAIQQLPLPFSSLKHYTSEIHLTHANWIKSLANILQSGCILLMDYGYGRREYYHPDRHAGTLMCFYQHHKHTNPFLYVGLQDITAHVDFTTLVENAVEAGLTLAGYTTQAGFLLACGLLEHPPKEELTRLQQNQAIKILTLPSQMGEIVKVIAFTKNWDSAVRGLQWQDRIRDL